MANFFNNPSITTAINILNNSNCSMTNIMASLQKDGLLSPARYQVSITGSMPQSNLVNSLINVANKAAKSLLPTAVGGFASTAINTAQALTTGQGNLSQGGSAPPDVMFNCSAVSIPSLNLVTTSDKRVGIGNQQTFPDGYELVPVNMSFYESNSFKERKFFSQWFDQIYDRHKKTFNFYDNYKKIVQIDQLSRTGQILYTCKLIGAYPQHVSDLNRSYQAADSIEQMSVSINYNAIEETFYNNAIINAIGTLGSLVNPDAAAVISQISNPINTASAGSTPGSILSGMI